jgi:hypothetical protein
VKPFRAAASSGPTPLATASTTYFMPYTAPTIDEYLHKRLMPVEGVTPHLPGNRDVWGFDSCRNGFGAG